MIHLRVYPDYNASISLSHHATHRISNSTCYRYRLLGHSTHDGQGRRETAKRSAAAGDNSIPEKLDQQDSPWLASAGLVAVVLASGVANRLLYKAALVPMHNYTWFLAQVQNVAYLVVYFGALAFSLRAGHASKEMLAIDKKPFLQIGACEAASQLLFMLAAAELPGGLIPLLGQVYMLWNLLFAYVLLGTRFSIKQVLGAMLVVSGAIIAAASRQPAATSSTLQGAAAASGGADMRYVLVALMCFAFPAAASCIKERVFRSAKAQLGQPLNIFVVNAFGSLAQSAFVLLLLPVSVALHGMSLGQLPEYVSQGCACILGGSIGSAADCSGAPLLPLLYVAANLVFNVSILTLLRSMGSVRTSLVGSCLVPLSVIAFTLPLPYLEPTHLGGGYLLGTCVLMLGLLLYNLPSFRKGPAWSTASSGTKDS